MQDITLILLSAGTSSRFDTGVKKQWIRVGDDPLWHFVTKSFTRYGLFKRVLLVSHSDECNYMKKHCHNLEIVAGGANRQESLKNALNSVDTTHVLVSDIARPCVNLSLVHRVIDAIDMADCIVPALRVNDTMVYDDDDIDRDKIRVIQTPQLSKTSSLKNALDTNKLYTDDSSAIVANGGSRHFVKGDDDALKLTRISDLKKLSCLKPPSRSMFCGNGFDLHAFDTKGNLRLCGVDIEHPVGLKAHSDGDVALHALIDALLGAVGMGDIGELFPDSDSQYSGINSAVLLSETVSKIRGYGFEIINVDITIIAQTPKISRYKTAMQMRVAELLGIPPIKVNIKATTTEELGTIGRKEGVAVMATATTNYLDWTTL